MKQMLREYGRVILVLIFFLIIFLLTPVLAKPLFQSADSVLEESRHEYSKEDYFYFYIDNKRYMAYAGMSWQDWVADPSLNTDGFVIQQDPCGTWYLAKSFTKEGIEIEP